MSEVYGKDHKRCEDRPISRMAAEKNSQYWAASGKQYRGYYKLCVDGERSAVARL